MSDPLEIKVLYDPQKGGWAVRARGLIADSDRYFACLWPFDDDMVAAREFAQDENLVWLIFNLEMERHARTEGLSS